MKNTELLAAVVNLYFPPSNLHTPYLVPKSTERASRPPSAFGERSSEPLVRLICVKSVASTGHLSSKVTVVAIFEAAFEVVASGLT